MKSFFLIWSWLPAYPPRLLRGDVIAALTVWTLLVPEALAYAGIAGMPPQTGLYTAPLALLAYAIIASFLRLGVMADFLSRPVLGGFVVGVAISIVVGLFLPMSRISSRPPGRPSLMKIPHPTFGDGVYFHGFGKRINEKE